MSQTQLSAFEEPYFLDSLTDAEYEAYMAVEEGGLGVREFARRTDRSPGTVGNLLNRARAKVNGGDST